MLLTGTFVVLLDVFIVNVAIPSLRADLGASAAAIQWVVAGFALTFGCGLLVGARLGDRFGRRRIFMIGMALFTLASAVCGLADTSGQLIAGRIAQGAAAALLNPQILAIISASRVGAARARAVTAYAVTMGMAAASGQLIGGALTHADVAGLGWRGCFLINVPVGVAALALAPRAIRESRATDGAPAGADAAAGARRAGGVDVLGAVLASAALFALVLPLVQGREAGWPLWAWVLLGVAAVGLGEFVAYQRWRARRGRAVLVDLAMFRERAFSVGLAAAALFFTTIASLFLFLALYLQSGLGLNAMDAGLVFTQMCAGYLLTAFGGRPLVRRLGRTALALGAVEMAAGLGLLALAVDHIGTDGAIGWLSGPLVVIGAGMGMVMVPLTEVVLAGVTPRLAGTASGMLATVQQVGNALGVAIVGTIFFGALPDAADPADYPRALNLAIAYLAPACVASAVLLLLLPGRRAGAGSTARTADTAGSSAPVATSAAEPAGTAAPAR